MDIRFHRKNMEVSEDLRTAVGKKLGKLGAFLDESGWVEVGFVEERNPRIPDKIHCELVAHVKGKRMKVEGSAGDALTALEDAAHKLDQQVRRVKDKRTNRHLPRRVSTISSSSDESIDTASAPEEGSTGPVIVRIERADLKPMTPDEAVLQLEVLDREFLLFPNAETGNAAVIFRRGDGTFGLIEATG